MNKMVDKSISEDNKIITKYLLLGLSRSEIAKKMNFSVSTVAYKLNKLFNSYNAKNRHEFLLSIFSEIIRDKKTEIKAKDSKVKELNDEIKNLKMFLINIVNSNKNNEKLLFWIKKTKAYFKM